MKIQEFVNPYPNIVLTWLWCPWILPDKLAPEGVELEFRWVIPKQAKKKLSGILITVHAHVDVYLLCTHMCVSE